MVEHYLARLIPRNREYSGAANSLPPLPTQFTPA